jgi:hypothetical protein
MAMLHLTDAPSKQTWPQNNVPSMTICVRASRSIFKASNSLPKNGALMGPWNPWLREPNYGKLVWDLTLAISVNPLLPRNAREVAILVTGTTFHSAYELYAHVFIAENARTFGQ